MNLTDNILSIRNQSIIFLVLSVYFYFDFNSKLEFVASVSVLLVIFVFSQYFRRLLNKPSRKSILAFLIVLSTVLLLIPFGISFLSYHIAITDRPVIFASMYKSVVAFFIFTTIMFFAETPGSASLSSLLKNKVQKKKV